MNCERFCHSIPLEQREFLQLHQCLCPFHSAADDGSQFAVESVRAVDQEIDEDAIWIEKRQQPKQFRSMLVSTSYDFKRHRPRRCNRVFIRTVTGWHPLVHTLLICGIVVEKSNEISSCFSHVCSCLFDR